jgi:hypothetical protein
MFTFKPLTDSTAAYATSRMRVPMLQTYKQQPAASARFRGSLLALFGVPLESSTDADGAFTYVLEVQNAQGQTWIMTAYEGPSGPAFGGPMRTGTDEPVRAAEELLTLIDATPPADFDIVLEAPEYASRIRYGCHAGECYWHEEPQ